MSATILVVDDELMIRKYHSMLLEADGYQTHEAENGVEAIEKLLLTPCDLILVDVNMPKMDGYRLVQEMREIPELAAIPVVMISAEEDSSDRDLAMSAGVNVYLVKPVRPKVLLENIAELLVETGFSGAA